MKALNYLISLSLLCSAVFGEEKEKQSLETYISKNKSEQFKYDYKKVDAQSSKLRDSWIAPIYLQYTNSKSNPYEKIQTIENATLTISQPIFQSGGIYYGIKYAQAYRKYSNYSVDVAKRKLVKDAISLLMQIKQIDLKIKRQTLQIANSDINLDQKKEQYLNGQLDSGFLDDAIINRNIAIQALYDIETNKERLISQFNVISDMAYQDATIPHLDIVNEQEFLKHNIVLNMSVSDVEQKKYNKNVTVTKYLPQVSLTGGYTWNEYNNYGSSYYTKESNYYNYGIKATIPLDINTFRDIESSRVDFLKSKLLVEDTKKEMQALFEQVMQNIKNFDKKILLSKENKKLYEKLLAETKSLFEAGYKTSYDVELLKNSVAIQTQDLEIFKMDKQLELLTLYEMYKNE